jgi:hypothetical protein
MIVSSNLKRATAKGLFWSAVERFGNYLEENLITIYISSGYLKCVLLEDGLFEILYLKCK